jgi:chorismate mutase
MSSELSQNNNDNKDNVYGEQIQHQYQLQETCISSLKELFKNYENNEYMLQRIHTHINNYLPNTLKNEQINYVKRVNRNHCLTNEQQIFIQVFLSKNQYYYLSSNGYFYEYDGKNYFIVKEDDITHKLLSSISKERVLLDWKHKTKINVIKLIKERNLLNSIPETDTIQNVLGLIYPSLFSSKNQAKYFLTIIGDNIYKKNQHLLFFISQNMKKLFTDLDNISYFSIGNTNTTNNFVTKYHENNSYENYRLLKINENFSQELWKEQLKKNGLDLLCVACHYSKRYEDSEKFLENKSDEELKQFVLYLRCNNQEKIIETFCENYLNKVDDSNSTIQWKNLHFIWKQFLSANSLPNMIYSNSLKSMLKDMYHYDESNDCFTNLTSKYLPVESDFIKFWEKTIHITENNGDNETESFDELEIDELCMLFKIWTQTNSAEEKLITNGNIKENILLAFRLGLSERVAEIKLQTNPFEFLKKDSSTLECITNMDVEKHILQRASENLRESLMIKVMDLSKWIQVKYIEEMLQNIKIGYLFGLNTFSYEAVERLYGKHIICSNIDDIYRKLINKEIHYGLVPTYNIKIGIITNIPNNFKNLGNINIPIELSIWSNTKDTDEYDIFYVEPHVEKEVGNTKLKFKNKVLTSSSRQGILDVINSKVPAVTIASSKPNGMLYKLKDIHDPNNRTYFSLIANN